MYFAKFLNAFVKPRNLNFKLPFRRYIICWGNLSLSKIIGGGEGGGGRGAPRTAASSYSAKLSISFGGHQSQTIERIKA